MLRTNPKMTFSMGGRWWR